MHTLKSLVLVLFLGLSATGFSQSKEIGFTGSVSEQNGTPIPYASVGLYSLPDSALMGGAATDFDGKFIVPAKPGKYFLKITFLSFEDKIVPNLSIAKTSVAVGNIKLELGSKTMEEFTIEEDRPLMELKLDKRVYNVEKDIANKGANAAEVLDNIPSVTVDVEGNVSLRGSDNVRILIDGKPSGLTGISGNDALRQLGGDMVDRVEIITNPSARYDAEGEVGIINIILKKEKRKGMNGSFEGRVGYPDRHGVSFNLNMRKNKVNVFTSYGLNYRRTPGQGESSQTFMYPDTTFSYDITRRHTRGGLGHNFTLGTEIEVSPMSTITVSGLYSNSVGNNVSEVEYTDYDLNNVQTQVVNRDEDERDEDLTKELNFNYRKTFKKEGRLFTFDSKWTDGSENELSEIIESSVNPDYVPLLQRSINNELDKRWLFQTDYVHPFKKDGVFEMGAKVMLRELDITYRLEDQADDASWVVNDLYDNQMIYTENIYAAYVMAGNKTGKLSYQLGLRTEYSDVTTELVKTEEINARDYIGFFPSAHLSYELKKENFMQVSYSRRIGRPRHWWLIPFFGFSDVRNIMTGNPNINPEYTDSYEIGYLNQFEKGSFLSSVYYRHTTGLMTRIVLSDSSGITRRFPINLGTEDSYGVEFSGSYELTKNWNTNANFNFFRAIEEGSYEGIDYDADTYAWTARFSSKWKIKRKFSCQTSFDYRSGRTTSQGKSLDMYTWSGGAALDILNGNGTLSFSARDILNSRKRRSETIATDFVSYSEFQWHSRQLMLTFNYRLNQKKRPERGGFEGGGDGDM